jgi:DNA polymerase-3 subunit epsilon
MRQIFLDTETTGLSPDNGDRVIEIGCVELLHRKLTGNNMHFYLNPGRDSHEEALRVHGISNEFLRDKPVFATVADELMTYLAGAEIIIHNAPFDVGFLNKELQLIGRGPFTDVACSIVDTLAMAKEMYPGKRNSLDSLCDRLEVDNSGRTLHGALLDAELLADVYINMTRGQEALLIESDSAGHDEVGTVTAVDLSSLSLPVLQASDAEREAHAQVMLDLAKASGGKVLWPAAEVH